MKPGSLFPKHLLYLLAPSYQVAGGWIFLGGRTGCCDKFFGERLVMYLGGMHPFYARIRDFSSFELARENDMIDMIC